FITERALTIGVDANGRAYVGGTLPTGNGFGRLNADGSFDQSFNPFIGFGVNHAILLANGQFLVGGMNGGIKRISANGIVDPSFTVSGVSITTNDFVIQGDGKIVAAGFVGNGPAGTRALVRLGQNGELDPSYMPDVSIGDVAALV